MNWSSTAARLLITRRTSATNWVLFGASIDYIVVDGNHWPSSDQEQYLIYNFSGDGGYYSNWSNQGLLLHPPGIYGPYAFGSNETVKVF